MERWLKLRTFMGDAFMVLSCCTERAFWVKRHQPPSYGSGKGDESRGVWMDTVLFRGLSATRLWTTEGGGGCFIIHDRDGGIPTTTQKSYLLQHLKTSYWLMTRLDTDMGLTSGVGLCQLQSAPPFKWAGPYHDNRELNHAAFDVECQISCIFTSNITYLIVFFAFLKKSCSSVFSL